jgi:hypothetical protein
LGHLCISRKAAHWNADAHAKIYLMINYSDIQNGFNGSGNFASTPFFVRSPSSGLDGVWGTADEDYGNLRIKA